jgi:RNA polymerase sigma-70 factor (ECF subfamily)
MTPFVMLRRRLRLWRKRVMRDNRETPHGAANVGGGFNLLGAFTDFGYAAVMRDSSDEKLMQRYARGDAKAFDELYSRHRGPLYRYFIRQLGEPAAANDLYQGAWEKIIKSRKSYNREFPFTTWMYRIAHNHLVDYFRGLRPEDEIETDKLAGDHADPVLEISKAEQNDRLKNGIIGLPVEQRDTLLLKLEAGLNMEEIASVTGVSRETVKSRLRYAVAKLKRSLVNE